VDGICQHRHPFGAIASHHHRCPRQHAPGADSRDRIAACPRGRSVETRRPVGPPEAADLCGVGRVSGCGSARNSGESPRRQPPYEERPHALSFASMSAAATRAMNGRRNSSCEAVSSGGIASNAAYCSSVIRSKARSCAAVARASSSDTPSHLPGRQSRTGFRGFLRFGDRCRGGCFFMPDDVSAGSLPPPPAILADQRHLLVSEGRLQQEQNSAGLC
jgi:hypothetical protein